MSILLVACYLLPVTRYPLLASPYIYTASAADVEGKTEYFRNLLRKEQATYEDAIHSTARYKGYDGNTDVAAEIKFLADKGIQFPKGIESLLARPLDKGAATHLLMKALDVKGGVMYRLFPASQRYALREAVDLGFLPATSVLSEKMAGADLLGFLVKVVDYTNKKGAEDDSQ